MDRVFESTYRTIIALRSAHEKAETLFLRTMACRLLNEAGIAWMEVFVGGGVTAVSAAVMAKLGVAELARRMLPAGVGDVGPHLNLPYLPVVLHTREADDRARKVLNTLSLLLGVQPVVDVLDKARMLELGCILFGLAPAACALAPRLLG